MSEMIERVVVAARCDNCRFYRYGHCHRHAPVVINAVNSWDSGPDGKLVGHYKPETFFPFMGPTDWCGDHEPKESLT